MTGAQLTQLRQLGAAAFLRMGVAKMIRAARRQLDRVGNVACCGMRSAAGGDSRVGRRGDQHLGVGMVWLREDCVAVCLLHDAAELHDDGTPAHVAHHR
jgi:hypothetical protein